MDIKGILREFTRRGSSYMPCHDDEGLLYIIWYLDNYHPYRQQGIKNWRFDQASSVMLRFKQGQPEAIGYYLLKILGKFGRHAKHRELLKTAICDLPLCQDMKRAKMSPACISWLACCRPIMVVQTIAVALDASIIWPNYRQAVTEAF